MKMWPCLSSLLLITTYSALASDLSLGHTLGNDLILRSNSCEKLIEQHEKICQWKKNLEPNFEAPRIDKTLCRASTKGSYAMTVSSCLPAFVKKNQNRPLINSGANCWGTAMNFRGISETPRFIWSDEMTYWLNSPVCRKLALGEEKRPGDILNVYGPEYIFSDRDEEEEKGHKFWQALDPNNYTPAPVKEGYSGYHHFLHSETYISDEITFGKDSPSYQDKFKFNLIKEVYGRSRSDECRENQSLEVHLRENQKESRQIKGSKCDYFTNVYRCENFDSYFAASKLTEDEKKIMEEVNVLRKMQNKLFPLLQSKTVVLSKVEQTSLVKKADQSAEVALTRLSKGNFSKNTEMLLTLQYFSAQGIRKSMELARLIPATEAL